MSNSAKRCEPIQARQLGSAFADVAEQRGAGFVNRLMLVPSVSYRETGQSSALMRKICPDGVTDRIRPSEGRGPGSSPGRDILARRCRLSLRERACFRSGESRQCPASVMEARQSSELQDEVRLLGGVLVQNNLSSECAGLARELAKLVDQVRFLARTLYDKETLCSRRDLRNSGS